MAIKRIIPERCPACNEIQARRQPNGRIAVGHNCPHATPGPPNPPREFREDEIIFVPDQPAGGTKADTRQRINSMKRIYKIGFGKTGTTSLHKALLRMGIRSLHENTGCDNAIRSILHEGLSAPVLSKYDAFTDGEEAQRQFQELHARDPDAKFILTTRNVQHWLEAKTINMMECRLQQPPEQAAQHLVDMPTWLAMWEAHHQRVMEFFADKPGSLLVFNCCDGPDGYPELGNFLGMAAPKGPFPKANPSFAKLDFIKRHLTARATR